ncbi:3-hydroxyacyl-CoA dehydrogenase family protein [Roseinatronobacter alkalisoli]|uniref:3-hydroxyacyl-CoA dehydrogenase NAD-binding domain-containing protein n=1 Tax=Roseinatronobacter alkalisoli TaxID=3028235 RepID=A0ABT5TC19_9RHOB|nr:3-hydroxyacyl-CoA dehydrogenase NAD-binding domain-containing protein [Roseinatronobacter sp. HJB301]MDD7972675.1 3-hydroxyacyl-CoA dehydrogenase NAD-binding domain-containing protein [Roseinatronobacter sp. HJB301]
MHSNQQTAVIGAGLMGHGIALTLARAGWRVALTDPLPQARASAPQRISDSLRLMGEDEGRIAGILAKIAITDTVPAAVCDAAVVFEAAPEKLALKQAIFAEIEAHASDSCILASNTSVMPITRIMQNLRLRGRALGTHWWNPPHMIPLVEVIRTEWTTTHSMDAMVGLLTDLGKTPVRVEKDVPGFIGNRLQHALWREAISLVERGICDAESVDTVVKSCFGRRLSVLGPLENADLVGTDLTLDIHNTVLADLEHRQAPSPYLQQLVADGKLGMKTGAGFRKWTPEEAARVRNRVTTHLRRLEGILDKD